MTGPDAGPSVPPSHDPAPAGEADAEAWLLRHGLPWFVRGVDERVTALLAPARLAPVLGLFALLSVPLGWLVGRVTDPATGVTAGMAAFLALLLLYAGGPLRLGTMTRWAARTAFGHLQLMLPLAFRALPLLLLFTTFLFINTEVWQVAGGLSVPRLWVSVLVFTAVGVTFLLSRLPEDVRRVERAAGAQSGRSADLSRLERVNLLLVVLVLQAVQVLALAVIVFVFFVGFGALAVSDDVVASWLGREPSLQFWQRIGLPVPVSGELAKVSTFLSAFAALYFTIYAVSDPAYRQQFFAHIDAELEHAVGVRLAYRGERPEPADGAGPA